MLKFFFLFSWVLSTSQQIFAQISALPYPETGRLLEQSFNTLPVSGTFSITGKGPFALSMLPPSPQNLTGWYAYQIAGSQSNMNFATSTGSSTGSGIYSYGPSTHPNRSLGSLASGTGIYAFGLILKNETGMVLNRVQIRFLATQWRKGGSTHKNTWRFGYHCSDTVRPFIDSLFNDHRFNFTSIHTGTGTAVLNGHLPANQFWVEDSITDIYWLPGQQLLLQWSDFDETGSDDAMGIDDFSFKAFQQPGRPLISQVNTDSSGINNAVLSAIINNQLSTTFVEVQIDTSADLLPAFTIHPVFPSTIAEGAGPTSVRVNLNGLIPATKYYYRFVATNGEGKRYGTIQSFITKADFPTVHTDSLVQMGNNSCLVFGSVSSDGGDFIREKGVCWGTDSLPTIHHNSLAIASTAAIFQAQVSQLPPATKIFFRSYCKNAAGIAYGNSIYWFTPASIISFKRNGAPVCNKDTIVYQLQCKEYIKGLSAADFQLLQDSASNARIFQLKEINTSWQLFISTGNKDGKLTPVLLPAPSFEPRILNTPYAANTTLIDKTAPVIYAIRFDNRPYKTGDSIKVSIHIHPEEGILTMLSGNLLDYPLQQFSKQNDSTWKAIAVIKNEGQEIAAIDDISINIIVADEAGNQNTEIAFNVVQLYDAIDVTRPRINKIIVPKNSTYKTGDSLFFQLQFSEAIVLDSSQGIPVLAVTVGTKIRNPFLYNSTNPQFFTFCLIVQPGELDADGIRISGNILLNNASITDLAGNVLNNNIPNAGIFSTIKIDAVQPYITSVVTPIAKTYGIGDSLLFYIFISESLILPTTTKTPTIELSVDNMLYQATYLSGSTNPLIFSWTVPNHISDKNGISIRNMLLDSENISDSVGNKLEPALRNIGNLSSVLIDGIAPAFRDSIILAEVCANGILRLAGILEFDSAELGETLHWTISSAPVNGYMHGFPFRSRWTTGSSLPENIFYAPTSTQSSFDECTIQVSDGVNSSFQNIKIRINPSITNNIIAADQIICSGFSAQPLVGKQIKGGNGMYQFHWEWANANNDYQKAAGIFDQEIYHPLNLYNSATFRRIVSSGACTDTSASVTVTVRSSGLWIGAQSNNWHVGANWCGGFVPDRQTDVHFPYTDNQKMIHISDSAFCRSLYINTSNTLIINGSLSFTGTLSGFKNIYAENGCIIAAGKEKQSVSANIFYRNTVARFIAGGTDVSLIDTLYIADYFSIQKGIFHTNNNLALKPHAVNYPNAQGTSLNGRISFDKIITGRQRENFLFHPFKTSTPIKLDTDSIFTLHKLGPTDSFATVFNWQSIAANIPFAWPPEQGMVLSKPGFPSTRKDNFTLALNGSIKTGDATLAFPTNAANNYVFTGNPYLAGINAKHITRSEGIGNYYWVWDTSFAEYGAYRSKSFLANNTILPFEGFIIKTLANKPLFLSYSEQAKLVTLLPDSLEDCIDNTYQIEITLLKNNIIHDKLLILDIDSARAKYDANDAEKHSNPESNLYSISADTIPLSVDARWFTNRTSIPLGIDVKNSGEFILRFTRVWLKTGIALELQDHYTGNKVKIDTNSFYPFKITANAESYGRNRFLIRSPLPPEPPEEQLQLHLYPVPASDFLVIALQARQKAFTTILIKNLQGQVLMSKAMGEQQLFTHKMSVTGLLKGHYLVEVHSGKYVIAKTFIKL